ncbi:SDR family oxidoreductase [[Mycobacterium] wendilense]|uniref:SDR family NAD(P)-dependent oxidoreductase n=1 Tax=[Mycobacterium] wendilense TaxID=3064284 RepID=A0ABM9MDH1_9MYCO|nr:SDR family NAD(P)-dependent oxidoreductase [Mycolicibacterium sp. MU0050]CAJ1582518.1 SDR family NAD(P)-dependent oxidoreductase [Mycolicibacterium sp. MU0050]
MKITGNTIFIPGSTSGIGLGLALALHARGNTVVVGGRRTAELERITADHPGLGAVAIDIADPDSIRAAAAQVLAQYPDLNVIVAMAGIMRTEDWHQPDTFLATAESTIETNLLGPIRLIGAFIEHLRTRPDSTIVTVSSGLAFAPLRVTPSYNASKAAIHMLSESLRLQLADTSVKVTELVPPSVRTELMPGHDTNPAGMALDAFIDEVIDQLEANPDAHEILVEQVKFLRFGEACGDYDTVVEILNAGDPHGK